MSAIAEMAVCVDLMAKGYSVFRSMSPHSPFDVIAIKGEEVRKIEVRTGYTYFPTGRLTFSRHVNPKSLPTEFAIYEHATKNITYQAYTGAKQDDSSD